MKSFGKTDETLNHLKLIVYDWDIDMAVIYYAKDKFCHVRQLNGRQGPCSCKHHCVYEEPASIDHKYIEYIKIALKSIETFFYIIYLKEYKDILFTLMIIEFNHIELAQYFIDLRNMMKGATRLFLKHAFLLEKSILESNTRMLISRGRHCEDQHVKAHDMCIEFLKYQHDEQDYSTLHDILFDILRNFESIRISLSKKMDFQLEFLIITIDIIFNPNTQLFAGSKKALGITKDMDSKTKRLKTLKQQQYCRIWMKVWNTK